MYKVFFNDRLINITAPGKITLNKSTKIVEDLVNVEAVIKWFIQFRRTDIPEVILQHSSPGYFFEEVFRRAFLNVDAAGGVVINSDGKILFILRNNKWDLPKGKIDEGELQEEAAVREVQEECGINGHKIVKRLPSTFHIYLSPYEESKGQWIFKETFWYEMEFSGKENGKPQIEENITEIRWFDRNELDIAYSDTYANLKSIVSIYRD